MMTALVSGGIAVSVILIVAGFATFLAGSLDPLEGAQQRADGVLMLVFGVVIGVISFMAAEF